MRPIHRSTIFLIVLLFSQISLSFSQKGAGSQVYSDNWTKAHNLFERKDFGGARYCFKQVAEHENGFSDRKTEAEFYLAYCAIELSRPEAEKEMITFLDKHPGSIFIYQAYFQLARQKYRDEDYKEALAWFEKSDAHQIDKKQADEFLFKKGYAYFMTEDFESAGKYFYDLIDKDGAYQLSANYYYAHIAYEKANYQTALNAFTKLEGDEKYASLVPYYISQIYFLQEKYSKLISYAPPFLEKAEVDRVPEIAKMIGLAYYNLKKHAEAIPYLVQAEDILVRKEQFALAYSYYQQNDYQKAGEMFRNVGGEADDILQLATYNLADCYLKTGNKKEAQQAFERASQMDFDGDIKKSALFNFAKITYELSCSSLNETIEAFDAYLNLYPDSEENDEAYDFLVNVYMTTKNYKQALASMDKIRHKSSRVEEAYQRVSYFHALELFQQSLFSESLQYLEKSLAYSRYNRNIAAECLYWKAEAYYRTEDFMAAILNYQKFIKTPGVGNSKYFANVHYNLGYSEFELDAYTKAVKWFRKYEQICNGKASAYLSDAQNRIGDCYFLDRNYQRSAEYYGKAVAANNWATDYAVYHQALSLGLLGKLKAKIKLLSRFSRNYSDSDYMDDALYELAKARIKVGNEKAAVGIYTDLISNYPQSSYASKALLQLGLLNYNQKDYDKAISNFKQVLLDYSGSNEAKSAMIGMKNIYIDMNNVKAYFAFVESLGKGIVVNASEKDSLTYLSAERLYMDGQNEESTLAFKEYLQDFPRGMFRLNAEYYKGEAAFNRGDFQEAFLSFEKVLARADNLFTEKALLGASQIQFKQKDYLRARQYFQALLLKSNIAENKQTAQWGLFRCHYQLKAYSDLLTASEKLILFGKISGEQMREIRYKRSKAHLALSQNRKAKADLMALAKEVQSIEGAESRFLLADLYYRLNEFDKAEKQVNEFIDMNSPHHYWLGKSFILLSEIYLKKDDVFQARYTLQSIVDNYGVKDDGILESAKAKLALILDKEKQNAAPAKTELNTDSIKGAVADKQKDLIKTVSKSKSDSLSFNDAKAMLHEMVGEQED